MRELFRLLVWRLWARNPSTPLNPLAFQVMMGNPLSVRDEAWYRKRAARRFGFGLALLSICLYAGLVWAVWRVTS